MVPTFSILFKQVTGELITSLGGRGLDDGGETYISEKSEKTGNARTD